MINQFWDTKIEGVRTKVCNVNNYEVAINVANCGVHALGYHLFKKDNFSQRILKLKNMIHLVKSVSKASNWVLTDVYDKAIISEIVAETKADTVQFQRFFPADDFKSISEMLRRNSIKVVKTLALTEGDLLETIIEAEKYCFYTDALLIDSRNKGGSGNVWDWRLITKIKERVNKPLVIAGGLTPSNVAHAIRATKAFAVDVQSGVESLAYDINGNISRYKDIGKVAAFLKAITDN